MKPLWILAGLLTASVTHACLWDSDTLPQEKAKSPEMADVILGKVTNSVDIAALRERITKLKAAPHEDDAAWWNDLAGAHIRLSELDTAVKILEPLVKKFPDDYGVHANLGTAYHLLGRYQEAEKEIARDLEVNPGGHFGLERYHLALLQYLIRDVGYQKRHLYVDECTSSFLMADGILLTFQSGYFTRDTNSPPDPAGLEESYASLLKTNENHRDTFSFITAIAESDSPPAYRSKSNLQTDPLLKAGVIYMATLNPKQPACMVMLGVVSWRNGDLNLAATAFEKAIALGSPQPEILKRKIEGIRGHVSTAQSQKRSFTSLLIIGPVILVAIAAGFIWLMRFMLRS